ncbi:peptidoglycan-binding domain-containing protein [Streptomyces sp. CRN 30]|uniref:peptidoglycan-binding domain-containing protein n=1 Tax=Streptomyces sp. CRN 30 TaxID=3075613 RepID=UPI002A840AF9|nr:peptidoglycan-binding domain-containing protein [Streptomyces sp. CRN 30]
MRSVRRSAASLAVGALVLTGATALTTGSASAAPAAAVAEAAPTALYCGYHGAVTPPTISTGSSGNAVREAQCLLVAWGFYVGSSGIDGQFGSGTRAGVVDFQRTCGIAADGVVGPVTWNRLRNGC